VLWCWLLGCTTRRSQSTFQPPRYPQVWYDDSFRPRRVVIFRMPPVFVTLYWAFETSRSLAVSEDSCINQVLQPAAVGSCVSVSLNFRFTLLWRALFYSIGAVVVTGKNEIFVYLTQRSVQNTSNICVYSCLNYFYPEILWRHRSRKWRHAFQVHERYYGVILQHPFRRASVAVWWVVINCLMLLGQVRSVYFNCLL
jgi:hypothetical protein